MKASELIDKLQWLVAQHGDLPIGLCNAEYSLYVLAGNVEVKEADHAEDQHNEQDDARLGAVFIGLD